MDTSRLQRGKETLLDGADSFLGGQPLVPELEIRLFRLVLGHDLSGPGPSVPILSLASLLHGRIVASRAPWVGVPSNPCGPSLPRNPWCRGYSVRHRRSPW